MIRATAIAFGILTALVISASFVDAQKKLADPANQADPDHIRKFRDLEKDKLHLEAAVKLLEERLAAELAERDAQLDRCNNQIAELEVRLRKVAQAKQDDEGGELRRLKVLANKTQDALDLKDKEHINELADRDAQLVRSRAAYAELEKKFLEMKQISDVPKDKISVRTRDDKSSATIVDATIRTLHGRGFIVGRAVKSEVTRIDYGGNIVWIALDDVSQIIEYKTPAKKN